MVKMDLRQGDCLELMKDIPDKSVDMILCDLPYGTTACKWDIIIDFDLLWKQYERVIKNNGAIVLFGTEPFSSKLRMSNLKIYKYDWYWDKLKHGNPLNAKRRPLNSTETISVFYKKQSNYFPIMTKREKLKKSGNVKIKSDNIYFGPIDGKNRTYTHKYPNSRIEFSNANQKGKIHPTQKPVALMEYLIKTYTNEGDLVLDNCMGSGTTGVACVNLNRNFIGIELDKKYFELAENRIKEAQKQKKLW